LSIEHCCSLMDKYLLECDIAIHYSPVVREYSIPVLDGRGGSFSSGILLRFCPWCGKELPMSLRDEWFERLGSLGYDPSQWSDDAKLPEEFRSDVWWKSKGL
jgi:hypothetical protein